jgi:endonuclease/exonuclease/phosphatase family metal-dependent hydrolase
MKEVTKSVLRFEPHSDRICNIRIKGKLHDISIVNVHAPTEEKDEEVKELFHEKLQTIVDCIPKLDMTLIMGDFNAQVGTEARFTQVAGKHTLHERTNGNRELTANSAIENDMIVASTMFQHKKTDKGTWISPDGQTIYQNDHVLINQKTRSTIQDE